MTYHITADHLVDTASKAVTEELFLLNNKACNRFAIEERDGLRFSGLYAIRESDCTYCGNTCPKKMIRHVTHKDVS